MTDLPTTGWVTPPGPEVPTRVTITVDVKAWSLDNAIDYAVRRLSYLADVYDSFTDVDDEARNVTVTAEPLPEASQP